MTFPHVVFDPGLVSSGFQLMCGVPFMPSRPQQAPLATLSQPFNPPQTPSTVPQTCAKQMNSDMDIKNVDNEPSSLYLQAEGADSEYEENDDTAIPAAPNARIDSAAPTSISTTSDFARSMLPAKRSAEDSVEPLDEENVTSQRPGISTVRPTMSRPSLPKRRFHSSAYNQKAV